MIAHGVGCVVFLKSAARFLFGRGRVYFDLCEGRLNSVNTETRFVRDTRLNKIILNADCHFTGQEALSTL